MTDYRPRVDQFDESARRYMQRMGATNTPADRAAFVRDLTLAEWVPAWWDLCVVSLTASTRANYAPMLAKHILPRLGQVRLRDLDVPLVAAWVDAIQQAGLTAHLTRRAMRVLSSCLQQAIHRGLLSCPNPVRAVTAPKSSPRRVPRTLSAEQIEYLRLRILHYVVTARNETAALRSATMVSVMAYGGLRPGELVGLKAGDIDFASRGVWVRDVFTLEHRVGDTKTHAQRFASLPDAALDDLRLWLAVCGHVGREWLFPDRNGSVTAHTHGEWRASISKLSKQIAREEPAWATEFGGLRPYDLRHTCASLRIRACEPLPEIASDLGHSYDTLVRHYTHNIRALQRQESTSVRDQIRVARHRFDTVAASNELRDRALAPPATEYKRRRAREGGVVGTEPYIRHIDGRVVWFNDKPDRRRRKWRLAKNR